MWLFVYKNDCILLSSRCNNVLYIRGVEEEDEEGEAKEWKDYKTFG